MDRIVGPGKVETTASIPPIEKVRSASNATVSGDTASAAAPDDRSPLRGLSLADASVTFGTGGSLVADYVVGADSRLAEIRLIDPTTHQVVAASPPDTIAQIQEEMRAYQVAAQSTISPQSPSRPPLETAIGAE